VQHDEHRRVEIGRQGADHGHQRLHTTGRRCKADRCRRARITGDSRESTRRRLALGGECPVARYNRHLRDLIVAGRATPSFIVSHELSLEEAAQGYDHFDRREEGWTKVLLHPAA
jgi:hypothetical protein